MAMTTLYESLQRFFADEGWAVALLPAQNMLQLRFAGENGEWNCVAQAREETAQFVFYSLFPGFAPENRKLAVAELLTRINYGLVIGNFELNFDDGHIRMKTSIDVEGQGLTSALIRPLVNANLLLMDTYFPPIQRVIDGLAAQRALAQVVD
jgi:hypothetical protein